MARPPASGDQQLRIDDLKVAELRVILNSDAPKGDADLWGLALSGGGIRSATFCLGVLQTLARLHLLPCFHYVSTVSGGGYIGAFLQGLIQRRGFQHAFKSLRSKLGARARVQEANANWGTRAAEYHQRPIQHLREYSNYISPRKSPLSGDTLGMVGTYVRNVLLIQAQLCALLLALSLVPLLFYGLVERCLREFPAQAVPTILIVAGVVGVIGAICLAYVLSATHRGSGGERRALEPGLRVKGAAAITIWLLGLACLLGAIGLAHYTTLPRLLDWIFDTVVPGWPESFRLAVTVAILYIGAWGIWLAIERAHWPKVAPDPDDRLASPLQANAWRFAMAVVLTSAFAGVAIVVAHSLIALPVDAGAANPFAKPWPRMAFGPIAVLTALSLIGVLHLGLAGPAISDLQREAWARVGGKTAAFVVFGIAVPLALTAYGPWVIGWLARVGFEKWDALGWAGLIAWVATTGVGLLTAYGKGPSATSKRGQVLEFIARIAPWVFLLGLLVGVSLGAHVLLGELADLPRRIEAGSATASLRAYLHWLGDIATTHPLIILAVIAAAAFVWWGLGVAVDVNEFSLNAFYRNRLVRCYLGASNRKRNPEATTNFDTLDDLYLAELLGDAERPRRLHRGCRPLYPLICTALNLVAAKQLDWQDRKASSFFLSPLFSGHLPPASRVGARNIGDKGLDEKQSLAKRMTLGSVTAISGAAVNPNMGYHSSPAVTFLLTMFDARLGWWTPNLNHPDRKPEERRPFFGKWLLAELLGWTHDGGKYVHLSDGGHFENLGIYELVRRQCRFILCVDATADPRRAFADLGNAVHKCRVDLGASIEIDTRALEPGPDGRSTQSCAVGTIEYGDGSKGTLLYLKPTLIGQEPTDILHYANSHPAFPHEPTHDQFFGEAQFECYRRLGECVSENALGPAMERANIGVGSARHWQLSVFDSPAKDRFLDALRHHWVTPLPGVADHFASHAKAMSNLLEKLRETPALAVLDAQIYPAWVDLVGARGQPPIAFVPSVVDRRNCMPPDEDFRTCFFFCQELIRLMESVYHDLALEKWAEHPDNRGWMNAFRHWSWSPMFRIAWAVGAPTYGARFTRFCELRLDLPRLDNADREHRPLGVTLERMPAHGSWTKWCDELLASGQINHVERGILVSTPVLAGNAPTRLYTLRINWSNVLVRTTSAIPKTTLAIAAVAEDGTLRVFRVQDHVRKLGLGMEFMRLLISQQAIRDIDIQPGHYGPVGVIRPHAAKALEEQLRSLRDRIDKLRLAVSNAARAKRNGVDEEDDEDA